MGNFPAINFHCRLLLSIDNDKFIFENVYVSFPLSLSRGDEEHKIVFLPRFRGFLLTTSFFFLTTFRLVNNARDSINPLIITREYSPTKQHLWSSDEGSKLLKKRHASSASTITFLHFVSLCVCGDLG